MAAPKPVFGMSIDWETSGSHFGPLENTVRDFQGVSVGVVFFRLADYEILDTYYAEIQFDESRYQWSQAAQNIHGLTREHLKENGITQEQVILELTPLIQKYFGLEPIYCAGHNVQFDVAFLKQLYETFDIDLTISHRLLDTSSCGQVLFDVPNSTELYALLGLPPRELHNALEDAIFTVESLKIMRQLMDSVFNS